MITSLLLKRHCTDVANFGLLIGPGNIPIAVTLELPWRNNKRQVSSIPQGVYLCKRVLSPKFGDTFEVTGVKGRSSILFHGGNTTADTLGCILVGRGFDLIDGTTPGIFESKKTFNKFLQLLKDTDSFHLHVINT